MSAPEGSSGALAGGAPPPPPASAAAVALPADALSAVFAAPRAGGGAAQLAEAASLPVASAQPPSPAPAAAPGAADAPVAGRAALSTHTPGPGEGAAAGVKGVPAPQPQPRRLHSLLLVTDFFLPQLGGVEVHVLRLGQSLAARGHKVVVLTRTRCGRAGVRHLAGGLRVYYAPRPAAWGGVALPGLFGLARLLRCIILRERTTLLHAHAACSPLAVEALLHARAMGLPAVFTDHSLFGFGDPGSVLSNAVLRFALADACAVLCVSHTARENTVLRAQAPPGRVFVVPNGLDGASFAPRPDAERPKPQPGGGTVVCLQRLVYRKGVDLLAAVLPAVLRARPRCRVLVGGNGPRRPQLEAALAPWLAGGGGGGDGGDDGPAGLAPRAVLLGAVPPGASARSLLSLGHVFLSASLTESFGMACVEAACAGCAVVATAVGGVPETLPPGVLTLCPPAAAPLAAAVCAALDAAAGPAPPCVLAQHRAVAGAYSWAATAERTEAAYAFACGQPLTPGGRLARFMRCGPLAGPLFAAAALAGGLVAAALDAAVPVASVDVVPDGWDPVTGWGGGGGGAGWVGR